MTQAYYIETTHSVLIENLKLNRVITDSATITGEIFDKDDASLVASFSIPQTSPSGTYEGFAGAFAFPNDKEAYLKIIITESGDTSTVYIPLRIQKQRS